MYYYCDPRKNVECSKKNCFLNGGKCNITVDPSCSIHNEQVLEEGCYKTEEQIKIQKELRNGSSTKRV